MKRNKLLMLLAFLGIAATSMAQVTTFNLDGGSDHPSWCLDSYTNLNTEGRIWQTNPGENSYVIFKATQATYIQGYTIKLNKLSVNSENNYIESGVPYTWTLYGSNDKDDDNSWVLIHSQVQANRVKEDVDNGFFKSAGKSYTYYCNSKTQYLYYKFKVTEKFGGTWGGFKMARLDLIPSNVGFSPSTTNNGMDGNTNTSLTSTALPQTIIVNGTASARMTGFQFTTGSDNATNTGRNPKDIKVEGSADDGNTWNIIEYKTEYTGLEDKNYYPYVFQCYGTQNYQKYRFSFANVTDASQNFQMSELAIITESTCTHSYSSKGFCEKCLSPKMPEQDGSNVYQISNAGEFVKFAQRVNSGTAAAKGKLTADIDLTNVSWTPIGTDVNKYYGTFDGGDNSVTLAISTTESNQGLFGYAKGGADIRNLVVKGTINCGGSSAALIGQAGGSGESGTITISRVGCEAKVTGGASDDRIGAFVGNDWGYTTVLNIENSYNIGNITGSTASGHGWTSVVGCHTATGSTFTNVYNKGTISSDKFVNDNRGTCSNCYTTGSGNGTTAGLTQSISLTQVSEGELCYKLGSAFYQTLNTNVFPVLSSSSGQVILNGSYQNTTSALGLNEENSFGTNSDFDVTSVTVTRTLKDGKWNTFCVPFAMTTAEITSQLGEGAVVKKLTGATQDGDNYTITFSDETSIEAGKPYMVKVAEGQYNGTINLDGTRTITGTLTNAETNVDLTFCGTFTNGYAPMGSFIISNNMFYLVDSDANDDGVSEVALKAFRGYITVGGAGVKALNFTFDDEDPTGLNDLKNLKDSKDVIYNLAGQRIGKMQKGINIVNGKKVLF